MPAEQQRALLIRAAAPEDGPACGQIGYEAFASIAPKHGFPPDFPSPEVAAVILSGMFSDPGFYCVVAEDGGRILGSNCLDERAVISGVGPVTVDPGAQNRGIGRELMLAVLERANRQGAAGIRLVQAAFHNRSLSLYAGLGFEVREPLSCMQGRTTQRVIPGFGVRAARPADLNACNLLSVQVHGFARGTELEQAIQRGSAKVVERGDRITGFASDLAFFGYATAETSLDLQALIASAESFGGPGILVPSRHGSLLRWCLGNGLRVVQPMTLMSTGLYNEPNGAWLPSIVF